MTETLYYLLIELRVKQQLPDQTNLNLRFIKNPIEVSIIMFMLASHAKRKPLHNENNFPHRSTFVHFAGMALRMYYAYALACGVVWDSQRPFLASRDGHVL